MKVVEVARPFGPPHGNTTLWRYMPLEKFVSLVLSRRLFFANAMQMTDRREGTIPEKTLAANRRKLEAGGLSGRDLDEEMNRFAFSLSALKDSTLLNCWSVNRTESYALWKIYLGGARSGVAIRSTVSRLRRAFKNQRDPTVDVINCGKVQYGDFIKPEDLNRLTINLTKSDFYKFESEVRLLILHYSRSEGGTVPFEVFSNGYAVPVDTDVLIDEIYLSPFAGTWFHESFEELVRRLDPRLSSKVRHSEVLDE